MGTSVRPDPVADYLAAKQGKAVDPVSDYLAARDAARTAVGNQKLHDEYAVGNLARRMASENATDAAESTPSYAQQALGGIASFARDIPGAEALQAGARALTRGQSYREARNDIRSAEDAAPAVARNLNRIAGGAVSMAALPRVIGGKVVSPAVQGALSGIAGGALQSDPDAGIGTRAKDAAIDGAIGGAVGKAADAATNLVRSAFTPSLGKQAIARKTAMGVADATNYGAAEAEAAANGGTSPAIQRALAEPDIAPFVKEIRESRTLGGSDDATVLREAYKLMSDRQGVLGKSIAAGDNVKSGTRLENRDIGAAKDVLLQAAETPTPMGRPAVETAQSPNPSLRDALNNFRDRQTLAYTRNAGTIDQQMARRALERHATEGIVSPSLRGEPPEEIAPGVMPSLRSAVSEHARMAGEQDVGNEASDATRRLLSGAKIAGKNLAKKSPEAFLSSIPGLSKEQADAALENVFGRLKEFTGASANPLKGFGLGSSLSDAAKISPFVQALEQRTGSPIPVDLLRSILSSEGHPTP